MHSRLKIISDNILYMEADHKTDRPILAVVCGEKSSLIIDSGNSSKHARLFLDELKKHNINNAKYLAITHWHWDHIFGIDEMNLISIANKKTTDEIIKMKDYEWTEEALNKRLEEKIEIPFCAEMIKKEFADFSKIKISLPDISFNNRIEVDLGGISCIIENIGGDHSADSTIIYVKEEKVLFLGDCLYVDIYKEKESYDIETLLSLLDKLESYDAQQYVESHVKPESKESFLSQINNLREIAGLVERYKSSIDQIKAAAEKDLDRSLTDDDYQLIEYFINGLNCDTKVSQ